MWNITLSQKYRHNIVPSSAVRYFDSTVATKACLIGGMDDETADDGTTYMTLVTRFSTWASYHGKLSAIKSQSYDCYHRRLK